MSSSAAPPLTLPRIEWPTVALALVIYAAWLALTLVWHDWPAWAILPLAAWIGAWHMSLQHELIHGHPTRHECINDAFGFAPIMLWLPYFRYRDMHRRHHRDEWLTDPVEDPESAYVTPAMWDGMSWAERWIYRASVTFAGRLVIAPIRSVILFWRDELRRAGRDTACRRVWFGHLAGVALVTAWLAWCEIDLLSYALLMVWPATAIGLLRSLAEHRAAERPEDRTAIVEHGGPLALLFLFNNLHVLHHQQPGIPWYRMPATWRRQREALLATHHGPYYRSYADVFRMYLFRPHVSHCIERLARTRAG